MSTAENTETISDSPSKQQTDASGGTLIERLSSAGAHYGYSRSKRHPSMAPVLYGVKNRIDIIDLEVATTYLNRAQDFLATLAEKQGVILLVGTKPEAKAATRAAAEAMEQPYVVSKWIGGTLTNFSEIRKRVGRMLELEGQKERDELSVYTRQEQREMTEEMEEIRETFGGIEKMDRLPDAVLVVDPGYEDIAVAEAKKLNIPVMAIANTDSNIDAIAYPIPANDANRAGISIIFEQLTEAYQKAEQQAKTEAKDKNQEQQDTTE